MDQRRRHRGGAGGNAPPPPSPNFLRSKKKKGKQMQKRKGFKVETMKRLSPGSKYYCFGRQSFPVFHAPPPTVPPSSEIHFAGRVDRFTSKKIKLNFFSVSLKTHF